MSLLKSVTKAIVFCTAVLLAAGTALPQEKNEKAETYDLSKVEGMREFDKSASDLLAKNGFVVVPEFHKQIFQLYPEGGMKYVTTDSVFRTYHVLLEEALHELENLNAEIVAEFTSSAAAASAKLMDEVKNDEAGKAARMLAAYFGTAAKLADKAYKPDKRIAETVEAELANIARGTYGLSKILGNDVEYKFHYGKFKPGGIYAGKSELEQYFRTMVLYGNFGFRICSKQETLAAALLVRMMAKNPGLKKKHSEVEKCYRYFIGEPDDLTLEEYEKAYTVVFGKDAGEEKLVEKLPEFRKALAKLRDPRINDQLLGPEEWPKFREKTKGLRLFGVKYVPDSELFQDLITGDDYMPTGLFVASALGSAAAMKKAKEGKDETFATRLDSACRSFGKRLSDSNYAKSLKCLKLLLDEPPIGSPKFMKTDAWKDREAYGVLACWASMRHSWALQTKDFWMVFCAQRPKAGFVETRPDFYKALASLCRETMTKIETFRSGRNSCPISRVKGLLAALDIMIPAEEKKMRLGDLPEKDREKVYGESAALHSLFESLKSDGEDNAVKQLKEIRTICRNMVDGKEVKEEDRKTIAKAFCSDALKNMKELCELLGKLETMARKQLAGKDFSKEEEELLINYGSTLAHLVFYSDDEDEIVKDDMPLIADVYANPNPLIGKVLEVGIGKAMPIHVIIEHGGKQYLCTGGVMSYYEFPQPITRRLNDREWRGTLNSGKVELPKWTSSFVGKCKKKK